MQNEIRKLANAAEHIMCSIRSIVDGHEVASMSVQESALWARGELMDFLEMTKPATPVAACVTEVAKAA